MDAVDKLARWTILDSDEPPGSTRFDRHPVVSAKQVKYGGADFTLLVGANCRLHAGLAFLLLSAFLLVEEFDEQLAAYDRYQVRTEIETGRAYVRGRFHPNHCLIGRMLLIQRRRELRHKILVNNELIVPALAEIFRANDRRFLNRDNA